mgnify:CR=1 FL=1|jgi:hypothetical protein
MLPSAEGTNACLDAQNMGFKGDKHAEAHDRDVRNCWQHSLETEIKFRRRTEHPGLPAHVQGQKCRTWRVLYSQSYKRASNERRNLRRCLNLSAAELPRPSNN